MGSYGNDAERIQNDFAGSSIKDSGGVWSWILYLAFLKYLSGTFNHEVSFNRSVSLFNSIGILVVK